MRGLTRWAAIAAALLAALLLAVGCGDEESEDGGGAGASGAADLSGELGPAEDKDIKVALPFPDVSMYSFYVVAKDMGYYEEEGLNVEIITAEDRKSTRLNSSHNR
jgi:NitT/TauT family transport system substrate-binding protein